MTKEVCVPDLGEYVGVDVIEVAVAEGDVVAVEDTLITLETDKATMDIPAPYAGKIRKMQVVVGDKVSTGSPILLLAIQDGAVDTQTTTMTPQSNKPSEDKIANAVQAAVIDTIKVAAKDMQMATGTRNEVHAGPGVRCLARELGVNLAVVRGTGRKGRILKTDVQQYVKQALAGTASPSGAGLAVAAMPKVNFQKFGEVEIQPLSRIKKLSGSFLHRNWVHIPHVTHFDEADITELEEFRQAQKPLAEQQGVKLTPLAFIIKAVVAGLKAFPHFNSSLDDSGEQLVMKKYLHIGVAIDTSNGLVVPVVRDADKKGLFQLAQNLSELGQKARAGKLTAEEMQGGCFSISSLGSIGGTAFTPIVNAPEVAILGLSKSKMQPVFMDGKFRPRLVMPLSLSYDHRVIDGAAAASFASFITRQLSDIRRLLL